MYLAYKFVTLAIIIAEANIYTEKLHLPVNRPIVENNLQFKFVVSPRAMPYVDYGGRVDVDHYSFSFGDRHCFIAKLDPFGNLSVAEQNEMLSRAKSLINTNQAYQLATNWLGLIDVNLQKLEETNKPEIRQRWCWGGGAPAPKVLLPVFEVRWGAWDDAAVKVTIDGRKRELLELIEMNQNAYTHHPRKLVRDLDKLLAIPDEEFLRYSPAERSNLVVRFSAINYLASPNSGKTRSPVKP